MKRVIPKGRLEEFRTEIKKKHANIKGGPGKHLQKFDKFALDAYVEMDKKQIKEIERKENHWGSYKIAGFVGNEEIRQHQIECYCCGWLEYYDQITRNGAIDHLISFNWDNPKKCEVYIYPPPMRKLSNGPADRSGDPSTPTPPPPPY